MGLLKEHLSTISLRGMVILPSLCSWRYKKTKLLIAFLCAQLYCYNSFFHTGHFNASFSVFAYLTLLFAKAVSTTSGRLELLASILFSANWSVFFVCFKADNLWIPLCDITYISVKQELYCGHEHHYTKVVPEKELFQIGTWWWVKSPWQWATEASFCSISVDWAVPWLVPCLVMTKGD